VRSIPWHSIEWGGLERVERLLERWRTGDGTNYNFDGLVLCRGGMLNVFR